MFGIIELEDCEVTTMTRNQGKLTAYVDAFIRHDAGANAWALILDEEGRTVSEVVRNVQLPFPNMRSARLASVHIALEEAYSLGAKEVEIFLPDQSLALSLSMDKTIEKALFSQFVSILALRHAFKSVSFSTGTIDTLSSLSLSMA